MDSDTAPTNWKGFFSKVFANLILGISFFGCQNNHEISDPRIITIEADIQKSISIEDLGYERGVLDTVVIITTIDALKEMSKQLNWELPRNLDNAIGAFSKLAADLPSSVDSSVDDRTKLFLRATLERLRRLRLAKPEPGGESSPEKVSG